MNTPSIQITNKRSLSIDIIKGVSILSLAFNHIEQNWLNVDYNYFLIRSQVFFIIVGWLWGMSSKKRTMAEHWQKRKQGLVIPYLWFSIIFLCLDFVMLWLGWIPPFVIYRDIYKTLVLRGIGTLWFLPALLGGEFLFLYFRDKKNIIRVGFFLLCFTVICIYDYWNSNILYSSPQIKDIINAPFCVIEKSCNAFIYISIAYYFSCIYGKRIFNGKKIPLFISGLAAYVLDFILINMTDLSLIPYNISFILGNAIIGIGAICFFRSIESFKPIAHPLSYYGKNSLIVMSMHWPLYQIAIGIDKNIFLHQEYGGIWTFAYFCAIIVALIGIIELINRKYKFIIGK